MRTDGSGKQLLVEGIPDELGDDQEWICAPHSWHPNSQWVTFKKSLSNDYPIFIININTRQVYQLTEGYYDGRMWWSPDGLKILFKEKE
ncbi:MAG TPA: hypothetical protein PKM61_01990 [bacterium]|nr:hypothetical protein [bacterium]